MEHVEVAESPKTQSRSQCSFCIFSSWIPAIVSGQQPNGGHAGSIEEHLLAACRSSEHMEARERPRWAIPLCGGNPSHWVLGWVNYSSMQYGITDSMCELDSTSWAFPLLRRCFDRLRDQLNMSAVDWSVMTASVHLPAPHDQQIDSWSCGLFVMIALQAFADKWKAPLLGESAKEHVRAGALQALLNIPERPPRHPSPPNGTREAESDSVCVVQNDPAHSAAPFGQTVHKKRCAVELLSESEDDGMDRRSSSETATKDQATTATGAKRQRKSKSTETERKERLTNDKWTVTEDVRPYSVRCAGCRKVIILSGKAKRRFDVTKWDVHRKTCSHITGVEHVRVAAVKDGKISYTRKAVAATPSIRHFFPVAPRNSPTSSQQPQNNSFIHSSPSPESEATPRPCQHLRGGEYDEYILRTQTRSLGGVSRKWRARVARQLFPYKPFPLLDGLACSQASDASSSCADGKPGGVWPESPPEDGNLECEEMKWTSVEQLKLDEALSGWARWVVDYSRRYVKSTRCEGTTQDHSGICDACRALEKDLGLRRSILWKNKEAKLPEEDQRYIHLQREKFAPTTIRSTEARELQLKMGDPLIFQLVKNLERGDSAGAFLCLYERAKGGKLANHQTFVDLVTVMEDQLKRAESDSPGAKKGIRYRQDLLNFWMLMRGRGQHSAQQYSILASVLGGPCPRTIHKFIKRSPDVLTKPDLDFENVARVKRFVDCLGYTGPVAVAGDCTKVRQRLAYSNDHGSHILGSVLPLDECTVEDADGISQLVNRVNEEKQYASQVRAILIKIPLPQIPPFVVALRPTKGDDDAETIYRLHLQLLDMAAALGMKVISMAADGASSEQGAQSLMDHSQSTLEPLTYEYTRYGVRLRSPVLPTGPLVSCQDPQHARKTCRNQPQHGTHTASLGRGVVVNRMLVTLQETGVAGLMRRDVENVDKQDDGAARRLFHPVALLAMTSKDDEGKRVIQEEYRGLFVYLFIFGELFDAWLNRRMAAQDRVLAALRARFFLHVWQNHIKQMERRFPDLYKPNRSFISPSSFNIFNRLCDTLVLLILAYARFYPEQPFCPWLLGTEFVEHFFGLARSLLPNFTYVEFVKLVKHVMLRQQILLSGKLSAKKERTTRAGYVLDFDPTPLTPAELDNARVQISESELNRLVELAHKEATLIAKQLLRMPIPSLPYILTPLRTPNFRVRCPRRKIPPSPEKDEDEVSDNDDYDIDEDANTSGEDEDDLNQVCNLAGGPTSVLTSGDPSVEPSESHPDMSALSGRTAAAAHSAARYSALSQDLENTLEELGNPSDSDLLPGSATGVAATTAAQPIGPLPESASFCGGQSTSQLLIVSKIFSDGDKVSVQRMLDLRVENQSGTSTRSERVVKIDPKFALSRISNPDSKMSIREVSHCVRVAQDLAPAPSKRTRTVREQRWLETAQQVQMVVSEADLPNLSSKNVSTINPLRAGCFLIMKNEARTYLGEVLDVYKKANRRHGSLDLATSSSGLSYLSIRVYLPLTVENTTVNEAVSGGTDSPLEEEEEFLSESSLAFSCRSGLVDIHTHAPADHLLYNLGTQASSGPPHMLLLKPFALLRWRTLTKKKVQEKLVIRIPARSNMPPRPEEVVTSRGSSSVQGMLA
ncbi:hypothetical protein C8Q79DRAFT_1104104 [Trametes meyenii]|nr:hypothetical protein C8Q79DRAFT_1104104 [Trametes meyenii]